MKNKNFLLNQSGRYSESEKWPFPSTHLAFRLPRPFFRSNLKHLSFSFPTGVFMWYIKSGQYKAGFDGEDYFFTK